jgi:hypothetical protein
MCIRQHSTSALGEAGGGRRGLVVVRREPGEVDATDDGGCLVEELVFFSFVSIDRMEWVWAEKKTNGAGEGGRGLAYFFGHVALLK